MVVLICTLHDDYDAEHLLNVPVTYASSLEKCVQILCPFLNRVFVVVVVHFLPFCFPPGLRTWLPQREAS